MERLNSGPKARANCGSAKGTSRVSCRRGAIVVFLAVVLIVLIGLLGLVIDGGFLLARYRQVQNAADTAALAYAMDRLVGKPDTDAVTTANDFVRVHNGMTNADLLVLDQNVHEPPITGPYAGKDLYVEVEVTAPINTLFIQVLGLNRTHQVTARAVATWGELLTAGEGAIVLDPRPSQAPGFNVAGGGTIRVQGGIFDNNEGGGVDENGNPVNANNRVAASGGQPNSETGIYTTSFRVVGGVDNPEQFKNYDTGINVPNILHAGILPIPDPLASLETPYVGNGVQYPAPTGDGTWGNVDVTNNNYSGPAQFEVDTDGDGITDLIQMQPGVYKSISITGGNVKLIPGIYVISAGNTKALKINGGTVDARGIMFYNTGANYDPLSGEPDASDPFDPGGVFPPPGQPETQYGDVTLNAGMVFHPIDTTNAEFTPYYPPGIEAFDGMLFYQRRRNPMAVEIQGNSAAGALAGTIYGKWALFKISGQGTYDAQFIVGSMTITGTGNVTFTYAGQGRGKAPAIFLVE